MKLFFPAFPLSANDTIIHLATKQKNLGLISNLLSLTSYIQTINSCLHI